MNEIVRPDPVVSERAGGTRPPHSFRSVLWFIVPLLALGVAAAWLITSDWLKAFDTGVPPVEKITFERVVLDGQGIHDPVWQAGADRGPVAAAVCAFEHPIR